MKTRLIAAITALLAAMLACSVPILPDNDFTKNVTSDIKSHANILSVRVTPPSGNGHFSITVEYEYYWVDGEPQPRIHCWYTTASGHTYPIKIDAYTGEVNKVEHLTRTWGPFSPFGPNMENEPGDNKAGCSAEPAETPVETTFNVTDGGSQPPAATPPPAIEPTATTPPVLKGKIIFEYRSPNTTPAGWGDYLNEMNLLAGGVQACEPEVTIASDSSLHGECEYKGTTLLLEDASVTALVSGSIDKLGNVTFTYEISQVGTRVESGIHIGTWRVSYSGHGVFSSATQASGTAEYGYDCASGDDSRLWCQSQPSSSFSGSIPWSFVPNP
jgi:hypothetical protein